MVAKDREDGDPILVAYDQKHNNVCLAVIDRHFSGTQERTAISLMLSGRVVQFFLLNLFHVLVRFAVWQPVRHCAVRPRNRNNICFCTTSVWMQAAFCC